MEPSEGSIEEPLTVLAELKRQGLVRHVGLSNISPKQLAEAQAITEIVCVQNFYNVAHRNDDAFIDDLAAQRVCRPEAEFQRRPILGMDLAQVGRVARGPDRDDR